MALPNVVVAITKATDWHGKREEFDNVYYFDGPPVEGSNPDLWQSLVNAVVAAERPVHGANVEFMVGRVWSTGGSIIENITLGLYDLAGFGTGTTSGEMFKEAAVLVEWECDRANRLGRKVYLRKFIRPCAPVGSMGTGITSGKDPISATGKAIFKTYADAVDRLEVGASLEPFQLCSPNGRVPRALNNGVVNDYLISREFRRN